MNRLYKCLMVFLAFFIPALAWAQPPAGASPRPERGGAPTQGKLYGKIVDAKTKKGVDAASVQLFIPAGTQNNLRDSLVRGMLSKSNGDFSFESLPVGTPFKLMISAIGFSFEEIEVEPIPLSGLMDVGNIGLQGEAAVLDNVTVTATRPTMQMGIDRKVFNVEKNLLSSGGTAVDIMRNIPSVKVDVEGNIELRNSAPQIFVDGRPTILSLDQIPAESIERVELITNPSAKFDAASGGGIINVILKKNRRLGMNGNVSLGLGYPDIYNGNASLNLREGKFNFFVSGGFNQSGGVARGNASRENKNNGVTTDFFEQRNENERKRIFKTLRYGIDYFLDNRNTISISQNLVDGSFSSVETQTQSFLDVNRNITRLGQRNSSSNDGFTRNNLQLFYKHSFNSSGKELTADVTFNRGSSSNAGGILNSFTDASGIPTGNPNRVRNEGSSDSRQWTIQTDFVNPIGDKKKLEAGLRTFINESESFFSTFSIDQAGSEEKLPLSNNYGFREIVNAGYVTYTSALGPIGYQAGLRAEQSDFKGTLLDNGQTFGYTYPRKLRNIWDALFPSLYLTHQIDEKQQLQLNYSRRIRRPGFREVNPFIDINDPFNLRQGNPALRPEFINSLEFNYSKDFKKGNFLGVLYFRNNQGDITQYSDTITDAQLQQLNNAAIDPSAILNTYINANNTNRMGAEFTLRYTVVKDFEIIPTVNLQYRSVNARINDELNLSNEGFNWEGKVIMNYKFNQAQRAFLKNTSIQLSGEYESPQVIPQGRRLEQYSVDLAVRRDLFKGNKGTITFAIDDVFNTRRFGSELDTDRFFQTSFRRWRVRSYRLTLSYRFGDSNFSIFNRRRSGDEDRGGPGMEG
jgi:outer membrane receptor protein involved in Fe transport